MTLRQLLRVSIALALLGSASAARAGGFSTTNVQLLQGYTYNDNWFGHPKDKTSTTVTLNTFSTWEYGDSFAFADLTRSDRPAGAGEFAKSSTAYLEWHPRLFLNQLLGSKDPVLGVIRNWGVASEVNLGNNFYAYLGGLGLDFVAPQGWVLGLNLFYRYDQYALHQWQVSPFWTVPFAVGPVPFLFAGFVDVNGTKYAADKNGVEIWAQPELLVDVLGPFGGPKGKLYAGTEWYYHRGYAFGETKATTTSVPQAMVQWTIF
jgi:nucleoside-specific outer membrane channel protein Tsx